MAVWSWTSIRIICIKRRRSRQELEASIDLIDGFRPFFSTQRSTLSCSANTCSKCGRGEHLYVCAVTGGLHIPHGRSEGCSSWDVQERMPVSVLHYSYFFFSAKVVRTGHDLSSQSQEDARYKAAVAVVVRGRLGWASVIGEMRGWPETQPAAPSSVSRGGEDVQGHQHHVGLV